MTGTARKLSEAKWQLVPVEPTEAMLEAGADAYHAAYEALKQHKLALHRDRGLSDKYIIKRFVVMAPINWAKQVYAAQLAASPADAGLVEEAMKVMERFSRIADLMDFYVEDAFEPEYPFPTNSVRIDPDGPSRVVLTHEDFRAARSWLERAKGATP